MTMLENPRERIGANHPPTPIDEARVEYARVSEFLKNNPVITGEDTAADASEVLRLAKLTIKSLETAEGNEADPLYAEWKAVKAKWKPSIEGMKKVATELSARLGAFMAAEEAKRKAEADRIRREAEEAERAAREAERLEAEARENASLGEIGVDVGASIAEADAAFEAFQQKAHEAKAAERDATVRFKSRFADKATVLRTKKSLVLADPAKALDAIGITDAIRAAILTEARVFRKDYGRLPDGVAEVEERVL